MRKVLSIIFLGIALSGVGWASPILPPKVIPFDPAVTATSTFDVRTTGSDSNAGAFDTTVGSPGTDESQQNSGTSITCTLASGTTATCVPAITSTTHGPGNSIVFTSGTGCNLATFIIISQSGGTATFNGTVGSATDVCTGIIGGGFLTIAHAYATGVSNNTTYIQKGTYALTSALVPLCGGTIGYNSTHGDLAAASQATIEANRPLITTATNSTNLFTGTANCGGTMPLAFQFLALTNTAATHAIGICWNGANGHGYIDDVSFSGFTTAIDDGNSCNSWQNMDVRRSEFTSPATTSSYAIYATGNLSLSYDNIHNFNASANTSGIIYAPGANTVLMVDHTIFDSNTVHSSNFQLNAAGSNMLFKVTNTVFYNLAGTTSYAAYAASGAILFQGDNDIFDNNAGYALGVNTTLPAATFCDFCAFRANTSGDSEGGPVTYSNKITPSVSPFTNPSGHDFSLNNTAGGGALLRQLGYPGVYPAQNTTSYYSVGLAEPQASAGNGSGGSYMTQQ